MTEGQVRAIVRGVLDGDVDGRYIGDTIVDQIVEEILALASANFQEPNSGGQTSESVPEWNRYSFVAPPPGGWRQRAARASGAEEALAPDEQVVLYEETGRRSGW